MCVFEARRGDRDPAPYVARRLGLARAVPGSLGPCLLAFGGVSERYAVGEQPDQNAALSSTLELYRAGRDTTDAARALSTRGT